MEAIKRPGTPWTIKEVRYIQNNPHHSIDEMCQHLGRSRGSISMARHRLLVRGQKQQLRGRHNPVTPTERAKIVKMRQAGMSAYKIAMETGRSHPCVCSILKTA
jgi:hypothetical protein